MSPKKLHCANPYSIKIHCARQMGTFSKAHYSKTYTMQNHLVQGITVLFAWDYTSNEKKFTTQYRLYILLITIAQNIFKFGTTDQKGLILELKYLVQ